jgi:hypothetical protein
MNNDDSYIEVEHVSFGSRLLDSIKGVLFGLLMFIASFFVLYLNEGRVDVSDIAKQAIAMNANLPPIESASSEGKLVALTGTISTDETIEDSLFFKPDRLIALERHVEMYSWVENEKTSVDKNLDGSETRTKTYTYSKEWRESPENSAHFKKSGTHQNPTKRIDSKTITATQASVGIYTFPANQIELPPLAKVQLNANKVKLNASASLPNETYIFIPESGAGTFNEPQIGDLRISYKALVPNFEGTVFGKITNNTVTPYKHKDGTDLYRVVTGSKNDGVELLHKEYLEILWLLRGLGFVLMWAGLALMLGPISTFLDIVPFLGTVTRTVIGVFTFIIALLLSIVTIIVSMLLHSPLLLFIILLATIAMIIYFSKQKKAALSKKTLEPVKSTTFFNTESSFSKPTFDPPQFAPETSLSTPPSGRPPVKQMSSEEIRQALAEKLKNSKNG